MKLSEGQTTGLIVIVALILLFSIACAAELTSEVINSHLTPQQKTEKLYADCVQSNVSQHMAIDDCKSILSN